MPRPQAATTLFITALSLLGSAGCIGEPQSPFAPLPKSNQKPWNGRIDASVPPDARTGDGAVDAADPAALADAAVDAGDAGTFADTAVDIVTPVCDPLACPNPAPYCENQHERRWSIARCAGETCQHETSSERCDLRVPAPRCADHRSVTLARVEGASCLDGKCTYVEATTACDQPPPVECDGDRVVRYGAGTCEDGECRYAPETIACDQPPPAACRGTALRQYAAQGSCTAGECRYAPRDLSCDTPPPTRCTADVQYDYAAQGRCEDEACVYRRTDTACGSLGCCGARCCGFAISNATAYGEIEDGHAPIRLSGDRINVLNSCNAESPLGHCTLIEDPAALPSCVCRAESYLLEDVELWGAALPVLLARRSVEVRGVLAVDAGNRRVFPGSPGGGSGGSFGSPGGGVSRPVDGNETLIPLLGGVDGEAGCGALGGWAGGGIQISAGETLTVTGIIDANGRGGNTGFYARPPTCSGAGGGGSGGAILLEAPRVTVSGALYANGGGGGGASLNRTRGELGQDGAQSLDPAPGGRARNIECAFGSEQPGGTAERISGGAGGSGASVRQHAQAGQPGQSCSELPASSREGTDETNDFPFGIAGGGGGGGLGRIRINTQSAAAGCACSGAFSPAVSFGALRPR